jgi:hypothetical protein
MKTLLLRAVLIAVAAAGIMTAAGCASNPEDSSVPWGKPAGWEGQLPGTSGL